MKREFAPKSRKENLVVQELDGEVLIYDLQTDKAFCLNITSALIWQACDGTRNVAEISRWVGEKLNTANSEDLVWLALDQLKKEKLIENDEDISNYFEGVSRREVIKKIGLSSMIALPIVSSLVAPMAASAASICGANNGLACRCPQPSCPSGPFPTPAPSGTCPGSPNTTFGGMTFTNCSSVSGCICQGPFICISSTIKQGTCA